ncbi:hypothetical protein VD0002_g9444 [Verticillium dahliae]|nr:hypothetical protein VD0002_g9444 [Verticillium dahliae]
MLHGTNPPLPLDPTASGAAPITQCTPCSPPAMPTEVRILPEPSTMYSSRARTRRFR